VTRAEYSAFGLGIASEVDLPELAPGEGAADVHIVRGEVEPPGAGPPLRMVGDTIDLCYRDVARYRARGGDTLVVDADPAAPDHVVRLFLLGPALAALQHQRERLLLHASSVAIAGGAVAFAGESGFGKSTLAAAFHRRGYEVLSDDVTPVVIGDEIDALPGYPQLKLHPRTATRLLRQDRAARPLHPLDERFGFPLAARVDGGARPLRRIYLLAEGARPAAQRVAPHVAPMELLRHSYAVRLLGRAAARDLLPRAAQLAQRVDVMRLERPRDLDLLDGLLDFILRDAA